MEPILQWILGIYATLSVAAIIGMAKFLYGIDTKMGKLNLKVELFMQSAEARFEHIEDKQERDERRLESLENKLLK